MRIATIFYTISILSLFIWVFYSIIYGNTQSKYVLYILAGLSITCLIVGVIVNNVILPTKSIHKSSPVIKKHSDKDQKYDKDQEHNKKEQDKHDKDRQRKKPIHIHKNFGTPTFVKEPYNGICSVGGGYTSFTGEHVILNYVTWQKQKSLDQLLNSDYKVISGNSGGSWFTTLISYSQKFVDDTLDPIGKTKDEHIGSLYKYFFSKMSKTFTLDKALQIFTNPTQQNWTRLVGESFGEYKNTLGDSLYKNKTKVGKDKSIVYFTTASSQGKISYNTSDSKFNHSNFQITTPLGNCAPYDYSPASIIAPANDKDSIPFLLAEDFSNTSVSYTTSITQLDFGKSHSANSECRNSVKDEQTHILGCPQFLHGDNVEKCDNNKCCCEDNYKYDKNLNKCVKCQYNNAGRLDCSTQCSAAASTICCTVPNTISNNANSPIDYSLVSPLNAAGASSAAAAGLENEKFVTENTTIAGTNDVVAQLLYNVFPYVFAKEIMKIIDVNVPAMVPPGIAPLSIINNGQMIINPEGINNSSTNIIKLADGAMADNSSVISNVHEMLRLIGPNNLSKFSSGSDKGINIIILDSFPTSRITSCGSKWVYSDTLDVLFGVSNNKEHCTDPKFQTDCLKGLPSDIGGIESLANLPIASGYIFNDNKPWYDEGYCSGVKSPEMCDPSSTNGVNGNVTCRILKWKNIYTVENKPFGIPSGVFISNVYGIVMNPGVPLLPLRLPDIIGGDSMFKSYATVTKTFYDMFEMEENKDLKEGLLSCF